MHSGLARAINLFFPAGLLTIAGIVTIYSIKPEVAITQAVFFTLSILASFLINRFRFDRGWLPASAWYIGVIALLTITTIFGVAARGSARWLILFGQQIQTSELAKIGLILFTATWFSLKHHGITHLIRYLLAMSLPAIIIFRQPDLGTALLIASIAIIALLVVGTSLKNLLFIGALMAVIIPIASTQLQPYQLDRLDSFFNPSSDPLGSGYNAAQATIAVGSGQLIGRGLGQGTQSHLRFLPERHTDFIFASFIEELGFIGGLVILLLYLWLILSLINLAKTTDSIIHSLICLLTAGLILVQTIINIGMNMGIMPITGITLPFMSYGGSSLISLYLLLGIAAGNQSSPKLGSQVFHIR